MPGRFEDTNEDNKYLGGAFYTARARFNSQLPLEYFYAVCDQLPLSEEGKADVYKEFRGVTEGMIAGLMKCRVKALGHVTGSFLSENFRGNPKVKKVPFDLPELGQYFDRAETLAGALEEFCLIERHVGLGEWKAKRLASPEERLLRGDTLIAQYQESDQPKSDQRESGQSEAVEADSEDEGTS